MSKFDKITYSMLIIISVFLMISRFMIPIITMLLLLTFLYAKRPIKKMEKISYIIMLMLLVIGFEFVQAIDSSSIFDLKVAFKEIGRIIIYLLLIHLSSKLELGINDYLYEWNSILIIIVGCAILQYIKIFNIDYYLIKLYGYSNQFYNSAQTSLSLFRGGSIFVNPNVFATFIVMYFSCYLTLIEQNKIGIKYNIVIYRLIVIGLILSGSRTGFVVAIIEFFIFATYLNKKSKKWIIKNRLRKIFITIIILLVVYIIYNSFNTNENDNILRIIKINEGRNNSLEIKISNFKALMNQGSFINYLIGFGPFDYKRSDIALIDFELGYFMVFYGILGIIIYCGLIYSIYSYKNKSYLMFQKNRNILFVLVVLLFGLSSGVFLNLRLFSVFLTMFTVNIISDEIDKNAKIHIT